MKAKLPLIARLLLGVVFFGAGLAGLLTKPVLPPGTPESLGSFVNGMIASHYFLPFLKATETVCGLLLLSGWFVPLALVVLAPITINIFLLHAILLPSGLPVAIVIGLLLIYLAFFAEPYARVVKQLFIRKLA